MLYLIHGDHIIEAIETLIRLVVIKGFWLQTTTPSVELPKLYNRLRDLTNFQVVVITILMNMCLGI